MRDVRELQDDGGGSAAGDKQALTWCEKGDRMEPRQYRMLKKIEKAQMYDFRNASEKEREIITYIANEGYIIYEVDDNDPPRARTHLCRIRQEGRAALYEWKVDKLYRLVPTYLAIFAAIGGYREELALIVRVLARLWRQLTGN